MEKYQLQLVVIYHLQLPSDWFIDYGGALHAVVWLHYVQNEYYPLINLKHPYSMYYK